MVCKRAPLRDVVSANEAWPLEDDQTYRHTPSDMFTKTSTMAGLLARDGACLTDDRRRALATAIISQPGSRLSPPSRFPSGLVVTGFAAYSCGGSLGIGPKGSYPAGPHRIPSLIH
jgi:hypothetical protein